MDNDVETKNKCKDKENKEYQNFSWKYYIENNEDLKHIETKDEAWEHWINHGKNEGRLFDDNCVNFDIFDWKYYIENNEDLKHIETKDGAWEHWINHGKIEGRLYKKKVKKKMFEF